MEPGIESGQQYMLRIIFYDLNIDESFPCTRKQYQDIIKRIRSSRRPLLIEDKKIMLFIPVKMLREERFTIQLKPCQGRQGGKSECG